MSHSIVAPCPTCHAVMNLTWERCPNCSTPSPGPVGPGRVITWQGADLTLRQGIVDFLHTDTDGRRWAFVTFPGGWSAVNIKYVVSIEPSKARNT